MRFFRNFSVLLLLSGTLSVSAQHVVFSNEKPQGGNPLSFTYDPTGTNLAGEEKIECMIQTYVNLKPKKFDVSLTKEGKLFKGTFLPADSTDVAAIVFSSGEKRDENPDGYYTLFYDQGKPKANSYIIEAQLFSGMGRIVGIKSDPAKALISYDKAFALNAEFKEKYHVTYLFSLLGADKAKGEQVIKEDIKSLSQKNNPAEKDLSMLISVNSLLKNKSAVDSLNKLIVEKYPTSNVAYLAESNAISRGSDPEVMIKKIDEVIKKYSLDVNKKADANKVESFYYSLANLYARQKNYEKFQFYLEKIGDKLRKASIYNSVAWPMAEKNENAAVGATISKKSLDLVEAAKQDEVPFYYASREDYLNSLKGAYGAYADTYAFLLHHLGRNKEALDYQEQALPYVDPDGNERYVMFLDLTGNKDKAFVEAEKFLKAGKGTAALKTRFKALYEQQKKSVPFDTFFAGIEKESAEKNRELWASKMINIPAPAFSLVNLKGETVSLASLKGKVVIVDYWATWCGPCVASFPGMQKAVNKYANNPDVVFLFINTWQTESNREKLVTDFIAEKKYTFNVLYDTKNEKDPSIYDVISAYKVDGIPTKFIIGPDGNIKFKAVGFSGSDDGVVKEIDTMVSLAGAKEKAK